MSNTKATPPVVIPRPGSAPMRPDGDRGRGEATPDRGEHGDAASVDPYAAYTDQVSEYEYDTADLASVLPPFVAGLLAAAGRMLALLAYRDALALGDRPLNRRSAKNKATVFAHLPVACDRQDRAWRLAWTRCLDDLAGDVEAGRAPLPRCTGERWALRVMADRAPYLLACSDSQLIDLGVPVPVDEHDYRPPYWDGLVEEFLVNDAEYSIPEAAAGNDGAGGEEPDDGWAAPRFWFSPYGITAARNVDRGCPPWLHARLTGSTSDPAGGFDRPAALLGYTNRADAWQAYTGVYRGDAEYRVLAEVLTPQGAVLLTVAAQRLAMVGYREVVAYGDEPLQREPDDDGGWYTDEAFLANLPPICDGCDQAWRLAMVRAVDDLAEDLGVGRAPLPHCNAEEVALHLILQEAAGLLEDAEDGELAALGLPQRSAWSPRHRQFTLMREVFFQDEDVLMAYDTGMADVAADPTHPVGQWLHAGDLRPPAWFATFANLRPRPAGRGFPAGVLAALRASSPALRFTTANPQDETIPTSAVALPPRLEASYELLVGLAQRRFFDRPCAVAMARTLCDLLVAFLDTPQLQPGRAWMLGQRATAGNEMLIVDEQFSIDGQTRQWRLNADLPDGDARRWALGMLTDCAAKVVTAYATRDPSLLLGMYGVTPPQVDPGLPHALSMRTAALAARTTLAGFLTHHRSQLGLTVPQVAQAAVLPQQVIAGWEAGAEATPSQLQRCAPVLQLPEDILLAANVGDRDSAFWPLPTPSTRLEAGD